MNAKAYKFGEKSDALNGGGSGGEDGKKPVRRAAPRAKQAAEQPEQAG